MCSDVKKRWSLLMDCARRTLGGNAPGGSVGRGFEALALREVWSHRVLWTRRLGFLAGGLLFLVTSVGAQQVPLRILSVSTSADQRLEVTFNASAEAYYALVRGDTVVSLNRPVAMVLGVSGSATLRDPRRVGDVSEGYLRIAGFARSTPLDHDGDGIDDLYELLHPSFLDPLNPLDAAGDSDGDGISNLEEYRREKDPGGGGPVRVARTSPSQGERDVSVLRETVFHLSGALGAGGPIGTSQLSVSAAGRRILSRAEVSSDRRVITLFLLEPLPGGSQVRVTLNGAGIKDAGGKDLDADGDGQAGGVLNLDFETLNNQPIAGTKVCGRVFASELAPGLGGEPLSVGLAGVTITVDGREESLRAVTDANGDFRLEPAPGGTFFVHIDGRTVTNLVQGIRYPDLAYYPFVGKEWVSEPGQEINIGNIFLPKVADGTLKPISTTESTVVTFPESVLIQHPELRGVTVTVPPNGLLNEGGTRGGSVGIAPVSPERLPGPLPAGLNPPLVITVQSDGPGNFDTPVAACFPNLPDPKSGQRRLPGAKTALWSFNHDTGEWEIRGSMTVSADGKLICTDPGVGIEAPGWHTWADGAIVGGGAVADAGPTKLPTEPDPEPGEPRGEDKPSPCICDHGCSVLLHSGEEYLSRTDLRIPGRGQIHFEFRRTYRSRLDYNGPLGFGWSFENNDALFFEANGDISRSSGDGYVARWVVKPDGSFESPAGDFRLLRRLPDGTHELRSGDGMVRRYRLDGRLRSVADRFNNEMLFDYDDVGNLSRIIDVYGREILFFFRTFADGIDRLVRLADFMGREVLYSYDAFGNLVEVRSPVVTGTSTGNDFPNGRRERYSYSSGFQNPELNHNILSLTSPEEVERGGPPSLRWTYGEDPSNPMTFDRILTETLGGVNASGVAAGGTTTYHYTALNVGAPAGQVQLPRGMALITEPNGRRMEYYINELNQHILTRELTRQLRPTEPIYYETRYFYNRDGLEVRKIFPEGNETLTTYQSSGGRQYQKSPIEIRQVAGARGGGEDRVVVYSYEPLFNQIQTIMEERGTSPSYQPTVGEPNPVRYLTVYNYDYQENLLPVAHAEAMDIDLRVVTRNHGDINGDGRQDQTFGNLVEIRGPIVYLRPGSHEHQRTGTLQDLHRVQLQWNDYGQLLATIDAEGNVTQRAYYPENDPDGDGTETPSVFVGLSRSPLGYVRSITRDARTSPRRRATEPPVAAETTYFYNPAGTIVGMRNPRGVLTRYEVNALNEVISITEGADITVAVAQRQLVTGETAFSYLTRRHYDFNGRITRIERDNRDNASPGVGSWSEESFVHDILGRILRHSQEVAANKSEVTEYRYDSSSLLVLTTDPEGNQSSITYDGRNLRWKTTAGFGSSDAATTTFDYDGNSNLIRTTAPDDSDGDGQPEFTLYRYDGFDRLIEKIDALGNRTRTHYDPASNPVRRQFFGHRPGQPDGPKDLLRETVQHFDERNRMFRMDQKLIVGPGNNPVRPVDLQDHDGDGWVTDFREFDALGQPTSTEEDDGGRSVFQRNGMGWITKATDAKGNSQSYAHDKVGNVIRRQAVDVADGGAVPPQTFVTHYTYDQLDRRVREVDHAGQTRRWSYDCRGNLTGASDARGPLVEDPWGVFPDDGRSVMINAEGNTTSMTYDGMNRLIRTVKDLRVDGEGGNPIDLSNSYNPDGRITKLWEYASGRRVRATTDDNGHRTEYQYNRRRQVGAVLRPDGSRFTWEYNLNGTVRQYRDPNNTVIAYGYDALHRRVRSTVTRGPGVGGTTLLQREYDGLSRVTRVTDDNGAPGATLMSVRIHDSLNRSLEVSVGAQVMSRTYAGDGTMVKSVYPNGVEVEFHRNQINQITSVSQAGQTFYEASFLGAGKQTAVRNFPGRGRETTRFDSVGRVAGLAVTTAGSGGAVIASRDYEYSRNNYVRSETLGGAGPERVTNTTRHDSGNRVVEKVYGLPAHPAIPAVAAAKVVQKLDGAGNVRQRDTTGRDATVNTERNTFDPNNGPTSIAGATVTRDANGNVTGANTVTVKYNVSGGATAVDFGVNTPFSGATAGAGTGKGEADGFPWTKAEGKVVDVGGSAVVNTGSGATFTVEGPASPGGKTIVTVTGPDGNPFNWWGSDNTFNQLGTDIDGGVVPGEGGTPSRFVIGDDLIIGDGDLFISGRYGGLEIVKVNRGISGLPDEDPANVGGYDLTPLYDVQDSLDSSDGKPPRSGVFPETESPGEASRSIQLIVPPPSLTFPGRWSDEPIGPKPKLPCPTEAVNPSEPRVPWGRPGLPDWVRLPDFDPYAWYGLNWDPQSNNPLDPSSLEDWSKVLRATNGDPSKPSGDWGRLIWNDPNFPGYGPDPFNTDPGDLTPQGEFNPPAPDDLFRSDGSGGDRETTPEVM